MINCRTELIALKKETVSSIATKIKKLSEQADSVPVFSAATDPAPEQTLEEKIAKQEEYYQRFRERWYFHELSYLPFCRFCPKSIDKHIISIAL